MGGDAGRAQAGEKLGCIEALVSTKCPLSGRTGEVAVDHVQCSAPFRMTVGFCQIALHDQPAPALHQ